MTDDLHAGEPEKPLDPKWDDPIFVDALPPAQRAAYDAETKRLIEEWEREEEEDLLPEADTPPPADSDQLADG